MQCWLKMTVSFKNNEVEVISHMIERLWGTISDFIPWTVLLINRLIYNLLLMEVIWSRYYSKRKQKRCSKTVKCYIKNQENSLIKGQGNVNWKSRLRKIITVLWLINS